MNLALLQQSGQAIKPVSPVLAVGLIINPLPMLPSIAPLAERL